MMLNQREALDTAVREGLGASTAAERAIITLLSALLSALLQEVTPPEPEAQPVVENIPKPRFQPPMHEEIARDMPGWQDHPEPKAQERLRVVQGFGLDYDLLPADIKSVYGSRFMYILTRARKLDEKQGA